MARLAYEEGLLLDVATGGELFVALNAGVPGSACVLHGNNKSSEELKMALDAGIHHIVVDNFNELDRIDELHKAGAPQARIQLRITPGVAVHTHEFVSTGQDDSKFGFNLRNGDAQKPLLARSLRQVSNSWAFIVTLARMFSLPKISRRPHKLWSTLPTNLK